MADISTWGWYSAQIWPGWNALSQDNLTSNGNGRAVDPASYVEFTMRDFLGDGVIYDHDIDDVSLGSYTDYVFGPSLILDPQEIALYTNSTVVIGGQTYTGLDIQVTLFTDGTWGARLMDHSIPPGTHHDNVTSITLGTWNGVEYDGILLSAVDQAFVCFTRGALIATPDGPRAVETLRPLEVVCTLDAGPQPILWIGRRRVKAMGRSAPVEIAEGVLAIPPRCVCRHSIASCWAGRRSARALAIARFWQRQSIWSTGRGSGAALCRRWRISICCCPRIACCGSMG